MSRNFSAGFIRHTTESGDLEQIQNNLENRFRDVQSCDLIEGRLLSDVSLSIGDNSVEHKLGRGIRGYIITRVNGPCFLTLTGSINPSASTSVTGSTTKFTTELLVGDRILVSGETRVVSAIASDTGLTVSEAFTDTDNDTAPKKYVSLHVYDTLDTASSDPALVLPLNANAAATINLWVF